MTIREELCAQLDEALEVLAERVDAFRNGGDLMQMTAALAFWCGRFSVVQERMAAVSAKALEVALAETTGAPEKDRLTPEPAQEEKPRLMPLVEEVRKIRHTWGPPGIVAPFHRAEEEWVAEDVELPLGGVRVVSPPVVDEVRPTAMMIEGIRDEDFFRVTGGAWSGTVYDEVTNMTYNVVQQPHSEDERWALTDDRGEKFSSFSLSGAIAGVRSDVAAKREEREH